MWLDLDYRNDRGGYRRMITLAKCIIVVGIFNLVIHTWRLIFSKADAIDVLEHMIGLIIWGGICFYVAIMQNWIIFKAGIN